MKISLEAIQEIFKGRTEIELGELLQDLKQIGGDLSRVEETQQKKEITEEILRLIPNTTVLTLQDFVTACDKLVDLAEKFYERLNDEKYSETEAEKIRGQIVLQVLKLAVPTGLSLDKILFEGLDCGMEQYAAADTLQEVLDRTQRQYSKIQHLWGDLPTEYRNEIEDALAECVATVLPNRSRIQYYSSFLGVFNGDDL